MFEGETLTALLARRDTLSLELSIMRDFLQQASQRIDRYSKTEIKILPTVDVTAMQKTVDAKSQELRQLDAAIQKLNWNTMLIYAQIIYNNRFFRHAGRALSLPAENEPALIHSGSGRNAYPLHKRP